MSLKEISHEKEIGGEMHTQIQNLKGEMFRMAN